MISMSISTKEKEYLKIANKSKYTEPIKAAKMISSKDFKSNLTLTVTPIFSSFLLTTLAKTKLHISVPAR